MKKKLLFITLLISPLMAYSEATQTKGPEAGEPIAVEEIEPIHHDISVTDQEVLKDNPWGNIYLTSIPQTQGEDSVTGIKLSMSIVCKGSKNRQILLKPSLFCGYQKAVQDKELYKLNPNINQWNYEPSLNVSQDGKSITVLIRVNGAEAGSCGAKSTISVPVSCPPVVRH
jgi:hypothetical protein